SSLSEQPEFYECLVRIMTPDGKLAGAGAFIPTAEKLGLMRLIDHRVLDLATSSLVAHPDITLAINISAATAMDAEWLDHLRAHIQINSDISRRMIVEITETTMIDDIEESISFVKALHELGCRVAIDDFGAGYTSFRNLKLLEVDMIKLDGAFVENLSSDADNQFFVKTLIKLAKNFGMATVAEWVETEHDAALLKSWNVEFMQGFLYGKPMSALPSPARQHDLADRQPGQEASEI
ncbi:MAG: EAL domain-containing protein, partial [Fimbriimonadaceae bacterium]|nr:EAL domain-containing protein [Alphaproteobacteria bacterium]